MRERKIIQALKQLSVYDLNSFSKFIHSPFFNVNEKITAYFEYLRQELKTAVSNNNDDALEAWKYVYGNTPFDNQKFLKLNSDLTKLLESFLAHKELEDELSFKLNFTISGARKRYLTNLYNGIIANIKNLEKTEKNQSCEHYLAKYLLERNLFSLKSENEKKNEKAEISSHINIREISDNLDYFYVAEKLRQYCNLLSWKKMYKLDVPVSNMDFVLAVAQQKPYCDIPPISIYFKMYLTYENEDDTENYFKLRERGTKTSTFVSPEEQRDIFATLLSYAINKMNKNIRDFFEEVFLLYKRGLEESIILVDNKISVSDFRNIVAAALRVNKHDWAENFIAEYQDFLDEKYKNNAVEFSLARLEFNKKNFSNVLVHLSKVNYEDVWYNINTKSIYLLTYYELKEYDALESLIHAFKMFIKREKSLSDARKTHYFNLIKYTQALMKLSPKDKSKVLALKEEITNTQGIVSKQWLLEKIDEFLN